LDEDISVEGFLTGRGDQTRPRNAAEAALRMFGPNGITRPKNML
jgi:hypothetical protein